MTEHVRQSLLEIDNRTYRLTFFSNMGANEKRELMLTLPALRSKILHTSASRKDSLPLLKLAVFGDERTAKGSLRHDANLKAITGIELDYDGRKMAFEQAVGILSAQQLRCLAYTTPNHTEEGPRWRVLLPTSTDLPPDRHGSLVARVNGLFEGAFARESFTLSQSYFFGQVDGKPAVQAEVIDGGFIDRREDLDSTAIGERGGERRSKARGFDKRSAIESITSGKEYHESTTGLLGKMAREGVPVEEAVERLRAIYESVPESRRDGRWQDRYDDIERCGEGIYSKEDQKVDPDVAALNENHALVLVGDKTVILKHDTSKEGLGITFFTTGAFQQWFCNRFVKRPWMQKAQPLGQYWLRHPQRRQYEGLVFAPGRSTPKHFNLWRGFATEPVEGDCSRFLEHLKDNVCGGREDLFNWVVGWFAEIVQHPDRKTGTSLVIRGKEGTGKTKVGEVFGSLFGEHYLAVSDPRYITGRFNSHMVSCLLLHAEEAFWAGDLAAEGKLKDLITGSEHLIEFKGKEPVRVRNYIRLFVTGNPDWIVPVSLQGRRFAVLEIGEQRMRDSAYFAAIDLEMERGGRAALLHYLLNLDLSQTDLRQIPKTAALLEQKIASLTHEQAWLLDVLMSGRLPYGCDLPGECPAPLLFDAYISHGSKTGVRRRSIETMVGKFLKRAVPDLSKRHGSYVSYHGKEEHGAIYQFPDLATCRKSFASLAQQDFDWPEPDDWLSPHAGQDDDTQF